MNIKIDGLDDQEYVLKEAEEQTIRHFTDLAWMLCKPGQVVHELRLGEHVTVTWKDINTGETEKSVLGSKVEVAA